MKQFRPSFMLLVFVLLTAIATVLAGDGIAYESGGVTQQKTQHKPLPQPVTMEMFEELGEMIAIEESGILQWENEEQRKERRAIGQ